LGLTRPLTGYTSEVLGMDQTARGMLSAFATFARGGRSPELGLVKMVVAADGTVVERAYAPGDAWAPVAEAFIALRDAASRPRLPVVAPATSFLITQNLAAAVKVGTGQKAKALGREAAGKTGTLAYDVWFAGFTGERAAVAWIGADRRERTLGPSERDNKVYGSTAALPMWVDFMRAVGRVPKGEKRPGVADVVPPEIVTVLVDPATGLLASADGVLIPHRRGTEPTEMAPEPVDVEAVEMVETEF
jgi:membrane carboxypeptidase/penicillin-binding protein